MGTNLKSRCSFFLRKSRLECPVLADPPAGRLYRLIMLVPVGRLLHDHNNNVGILNPRTKCSTYLRKSLFRLEWRVLVLPAPPVGVLVHDHTTNRRRRLIMVVVVPVGGLVRDRDSMNSLPKQQLL